MKKSIKNVISGISALALVLAASASIAAGNSWVSGGIDGGASVLHGQGGFGASYQGGAGTTSWTGATQVHAAGMTGGNVMGALGTTSGTSTSGATAYQSGGSSGTTAGSMTGSFAGVMNGTAMSGAESGAAGMANSSWF